MGISYLRQCGHQAGSSMGHIQIHKHTFLSFVERVSLFFFCLALISTISSCSGTQISPVALYVTRSSPLRPLPPLHITITDKQAVQQLYQAIYLLPNANSGKRTCLEDSGIIYHLTFIQNKNTKEEINVDPSGCLILTTTQGPRQENPAFLDLVMKIIHVSPLIPPY